MAASRKLKDEICWRIHAPRWAYLPLSGEGAAKTGGRFNRPGTPALYLAFDHGTAVQEYEQDLGWRPGTLCAYRVSGRVADLRSQELLAELGFPISDLSCPWKQYAYSKPFRTPPSWLIADELLRRKYSGAIYPSQANRTGVNLVLWQWNVRGAVKVEVLDPLGELPRNQESWK